MKRYNEKIEVYNLPLFSPLFTPLTSPLQPPGRTTSYTLHLYHLITTTVVYETYIIPLNITM